MCVCVCVCVRVCVCTRACVCCAVLYAFSVFKGVESHDIMQHFQHVILEICNYLRFVGVCLRYNCVGVRQLVCACVFVFMLVLCCVYLFAWEKHYMSHLKRDIVSYMYFESHCHNCDLTIV